MKRRYIGTALLILLLVGTVLSSTSCSLLVYRMLNQQNTPSIDWPTDGWETLPAGSFPNDILPNETITEETIAEETIAEDTIDNETIDDEMLPDETILDKAETVETVADETLPASDNDWDKDFYDTTNDPNEDCTHVWIEANCKMPRSCATCGDIQGAPRDHAYIESILEAANCCENGNKQFVCSMCEDTYTQPYTLEEQSADQIYSVSNQSVCEILTYDRFGADYAIGMGFVLTSDGNIVTNYHVIENACSAKITINEATYTVSSVLAYDKHIDLAILKIDAKDLVPLPICQKQHAIGKSVYTLGNSYSLTATFSHGIITYANRQIDGVSYIQHDAAISSGNAGGPLINGYGEIIGINTITVHDSQNLNVAISSSELSNLVYGAPLTLQEFYDKECNPFIKLKNHITQNGTYNGNTADYELVLGNQYSPDHTTEYIRKAYYNPQDNTVVLCLYMNSNYSIFVTIDQATDEYAWHYHDNYGACMTGTLQASSYNSSTLATYSDTNIESSSQITATQSLASNMMHHLFSCISTDFQNINVTALDLGFVNY